MRSRLIDFERRLGPRVGQRDCPGGRPDPGPAGALGQRRGQSAGRGQAVTQRRVGGDHRVVGAEFASEVHDGAGRRGAEDPSDPDDVTRVQRRAMPVHDRHRTAAPARVGGADPRRSRDHLQPECDRGRGVADRQAAVGDGSRRRVGPEPHPVVGVRVVAFAGARA